MSKVYCASIDCEYNKDNVCKAKVINLADSHIHTVHQGFKHIHNCRTYKQSQRAKELAEFMKKLFEQTGGEG